MEEFETDDEVIKSIERARDFHYKKARLYENFLLVANGYLKNEAARYSFIKKSKSGFYREVVKMLINSQSPLGTAELTNKLNDLYPTMNYKAKNVNSTLRNRGGKLIRNENVINKSGRTRTFWCLVDWYDNDVLKIDYMNRIKEKLS